MSKSNNAVFVQEEVVLSKIFLIRGRKVMLDRDLAFLYGVKAIRLREQVKRNSERFPETFMFQLTEDEVDFMVSQNAIPSKKHLGGYLPFVFTEYGVLMLANVIKSEQAIKMSIKIIEVFVKVREMLLTHKEVLLRFEKIENAVTNHDENIQAIFEFLKQLEDSNQQQSQQSKRKRIGYKIPGKE
jgi:hypothetical protein